MSYFGLGSFTNEPDKFVSNLFSGGIKIQMELGFCIEGFVLGTSRLLISVLYLDEREFIFQKFE